MVLYWLAPTVFVMIVYSFPVNSEWAEGVTTAFY